MCTTCGCGDTELVPVELHEKILAGNDRTARHNREHFVEAGVLALNLMGSPGGGKTAVLEATAKAAAAKGWRLGAVSADLATDNDARRLEKAGIPSKAITTGQACHLDAELVHHLDVELAKVHDALARVMPRPKVIEVSARNGQGLDTWVAWVDELRRP